MTDIEKIIPELWKLNMDIQSAYSGYRFLWQDEVRSQEYYKKYQDLKRKKELLLKPIFGA